MTSWICYLFHIWGLSHFFLPDVVQISISRWNFSHEPQIRISNNVSSTSARKPFYCLWVLSKYPEQNSLLYTQPPMSCVSITLNNSTIDSAGRAWHVLYPDAKIFKNCKSDHIAILITCSIVLPMDGIQSPEESGLFLHIRFPLRSLLPVLCPHPQFLQHANPGNAFPPYMPVETSPPLGNLCCTLPPLSVLIPLILHTFIIPCIILFVMFCFHICLCDRVEILAGERVCQSSPAPSTIFKRHSINTWWIEQTNERTNEWMMFSSCVPFVQPSYSLQPPKRPQHHQSILSCVFLLKC